MIAFAGGEFRRDSEAERGHQMTELKRASPASSVAGQVISVRFKTNRRAELKDITAEVMQAVAESRVEDGLCCLYVPHTTAGILINENDDPDVAADILTVLERLAPQSGSYKHWEGNADAHVKAALVGTSQAMPIEGGKLGLGRWQGIFFCEFDGPRQREVKVKILADATGHGR